MLFYCQTDIIQGVKEKYLTAIRKCDIFIHVIITLGGTNNMAVKLRLLRMGAKKAPFYRIVAADARAPRDGRFIELLGTYNPTVEPAQITIKEEEVLKWLHNGAQPSDTVKNLLSKQGVMKKFADSKVKKS